VSWILPALVEYDIEKDPRRNEEKLRKNPQNKISLIDVEGIYIIGYPESEI